MTKKSWLKILDGQGGAVTANLTELDDHLASGKLCWLNLKGAAAQKSLRCLKSLPAIIKSALLAKETRPRAELLNQGMLANFRTINLLNEGVDEELVSVRLWVKDNFILTVHHHELKTLNELYDCLSDSSGPLNQSDFLLRLLNGILDKLTTDICDLDDDIDDLESLIDYDNVKQSRDSLSEKRARLIKVRRYLLPQREAISRMMTFKLDWFDDKFFINLREILDSAIRLSEDIESLKERMTVLYEDIFSVTQEKINQKMYILAVVTMVFMPLMFITGLLGVNLGGIPGFSYKFGFLILCIILCVILIVEFIFLRRRKWV